MVEFSETLLSQYMSAFYGYGNFAGLYWFVGMEEGGGNSLSELEQRVCVWAERGKKELEDLAGYHRALKTGAHFFADPPRSQPTWNKLIRLTLAAQQTIPTLEMVKMYQKERLGTLQGDTCLIELLPLPSPSVGKWIYGNFAKVEGLQSRETYRNHYVPFRAMHLKQKILKHRPLAVIFYCVNEWYQQWWRKIADNSFQQYQIEGGVYHFASFEDTKFLVVKHPTSRGITSDYYHQIGRLLNP